MAAATAAAGELKIETAPDGTFRILDSGRVVLDGGRIAGVAKPVFGLKGPATVTVHTQGAVTASVAWGSAAFLCRLHPPDR